MVGRAIVRPLQRRRSAQLRGIGDAEHLMGHQVFHVELIVAHGHEMPELISGSGVGALCHGGARRLALTRNSEDQSAGGVLELVLEAVVDAGKSSIVRRRRGRRAGGAACGSGTAAAASELEWDDYGQN